MQRRVPWIATASTLTTVWTSVRLVFEQCVFLQSCGRLLRESRFWNLRPWSFSTPSALSMRMQVYL